MAKKNGYLVFLVFVFITGTEYLNSMEQEKEDSNRLETLLKVRQNLSTDTAKIIVRYERSIKEGEKLNSANIYFDSPCGAAKRVNAVLYEKFGSPPQSSQTDYRWFYDFPHS